MKWDAYIFDFDGTLVDSMPYWSESMLNILVKNNVDYPADIIKIITPLGNEGTAKYFRDVLKVPLSIQDIIEQMNALMLPKYRDVIVLKSGVEEYVHMLKKNGYSLNVLTASPHKIVDVCLKRNGIYDLFDNVWSSDDFGMTKSNPQIYIEAVKRIGCSIEKAVFCDDNENALKSAAQAGLFTVGVYDESSKESTEQIKQISNVYIESFSKEW